MLKARLVEAVRLRHSANKTAQWFMIIVAVPDVDRGGCSTRAGGRGAGPLSRQPTGSADKCHTVCAEIK